VGKIGSIFGGVRRRVSPTSGFWNIDLRSLGGRIAGIRTEALNLPGKKKPPRPAPSGPPREQARMRNGGASAPLSPAAGAAAHPPPRRNDAAGVMARVDVNAASGQARSFDRGVAVRPEAGSARKGRTRDDAAARQPVREAYLATHAVEKSFGGNKVVRGASLYVRRGEAVGLLGPNGAGKTTVFYMITGLIKADRGRIELDGHDITRLPMYQRARLGIGYLPQEASIFRGLSVEDNIRAVLEVVEPNKRRREADLTALLEEFGIARLRKAPTITLSGGERRRVEIARALASRPNYMLLDEPFAGIDPKAVVEIQRLVQYLTTRGIGVLITDHNVRETLGLTDRAYIIYSGEVLREGRAEDIVNDPEVRRLYLGEEFRM
jgi:lipopolysaccharide export system ATP-binding protein